MIIAIDGMSATGKSTLSFNLAQKLGLKYLNSGAIYRCVALKIKNNDINLSDNDAFEKIINMDIDFIIDNGIQKVYLDKKDVSLDIKKEEISLLTAKNAANPIIKKAIRQIQKRFVDDGNVVIEGRDIGTVIAPNADYKFYLYTDINKRAERLYSAISKSQNVTLEEVKNNLEKRDQKDIIDKNYIKPEDAYYIDTTNLTLEEALNKMLDFIEKK